MKLNLKMSKMWNSIEPHVIMELALSLFPFPKGRAVFNEYINNTDPRFSDPLFLGHIVLAPVNTIVKSLMEIATANSVTCGSVSNPQKYHQMRILLRHFFHRQYLSALLTAVTCTEDVNHPHRTNIRFGLYSRHADADTVSHMGDAPLLLMHLSLIHI